MTTLKQYRNKMQYMQAKQSYCSVLALPFLQPIQPTFIYTFIYGTCKWTENCLVSALVCNASGESDVRIECEHVTTQTPANCSFNDGPYHPCETTSSIHFAYFNIDMYNTYSAFHTEQVLCLSY